MKEVLEQRLKTKDKKVVFSYMGKLTPDMVNLILEMSESKLKILENKSMVIKRIMNVLIEILQNIFNHGEDFSVVDHQSFQYFLYQRGKNYTIVTENFIKTANVDDLINKFNDYLSLKNKDMAKAYRRALDISEFSVKGGAGLGLFNIVRKSNGNLEYKFSEIDDENSLFKLSVQIKGD
jgi:hypothetical protein